MLTCKENFVFELLAYVFAVIMYLNCSMIFVLVGTFAYTDVCISVKNRRNHHLIKVQGAQIRNKNTTLREILWTVSQNLLAIGEDSS